MPLTDNATRERIRDLNDTFRKTLNPALGRVKLTAGVDTLPSDVRAMAIRKVATFDTFDADNDPHGEHDFGAASTWRDTSSFGNSYYDRNFEPPHCSQCEKRHSAGVN